jgi:hypothetical protein
MVNRYKKGGVEVSVTFQVSRNLVLLLQAAQLTISQGLFAEQPFQLLYRPLFIEIPLPTIKGQLDAKDPRLRLTCKQPLIHALPTDRRVKGLATVSKARKSLHILGHKNAFALHLRSSIRRTVRQATERVLVTRDSPHPEKLPALRVPP